MATTLDDVWALFRETDRKHLLVVNSEVAVAVECKSHLGTDDVREHLERLAQFKDCFSQYAGYKLLGVVAAMVLPEDVGRYAYRQGCSSSPNRAMPW